MLSRHIFYGPRTSKTMVSKKETPKKEMDLNIFFMTSHMTYLLKTFYQFEFLKTLPSCFVFPPGTSKTMVSKTLVGVCRRINGKCHV